MLRPVWLQPPTEGGGQVGERIALRRGTRGGRRGDAAAAAGGIVSHDAHVGARDGGSAADGHGVRVARVDHHPATDLDGSAAAGRERVRTRGVERIEARGSAALARDRAGPHGSGRGAHQLHEERGHGLREGDLDGGGVGLVIAAGGRVADRDGDAALPVGEPVERGIGTRGRRGARGAARFDFLRRAQGCGIRRRLHAGLDELHVAHIDGKPEECQENHHRQHRGDQDKSTIGRPRAGWKPWCAHVTAFFLNLRPAGGPARLVEARDPDGISA